mmetsp:Transcript_1253/g.1600  ORF Transcript_1253/g.1600 Transcript_1253/m.1600 type:complete len:200 (+) Transcript_1253:1074-1673(+)
MRRTSPKNLRTLIMSVLSFFFWDTNPTKWEMQSPPMNNLHIRVSHEYFAFGNFSFKSTVLFFFAFPEVFFTPLSSLACFSTISLMLRFKYSNSLFDRNTRSFSGLASARISGFLLKSSSFNENLIGNGSITGTSLPAIGACSWRDSRVLDRVLVLRHTGDSSLEFELWLDNRDFTFMLFRPLKFNGDIAIFDALLELGF